MGNVGLLPQDDIVMGFVNVCTPVVLRTSAFVTCIHVCEGLQPTTLKQFVLELKHFVQFNPSWEIRVA